MDQVDSNKLNDFLERYIAVWNEPQAELRRKIIGELWAEDAIHYTRAFEMQGREAIEARVTRAYEQFVKNGGCIFKVAGQGAAHHNCAKFNWEMVTVNEGKVEGLGSVFIILNEDGRIRFDYQFTDPQPS